MMQSDADENKPATSAGVSHAKTTDDESSAMNLSDSREAKLQQHQKPPESQVAGASVAKSGPDLSARPAAGVKGPETVDEHITVLGAGSFGTAIGAMFARNGHRVTVLDRPTRQDRVDHINNLHRNPDYMSDSPLPELLQATVDPEVAFKGCTYVFHAIPIQASRDYLASFKKYIKVSAPL